MGSWRTTIGSRGAVVLSDLVACDGFKREARYRVQTHVHSDHTHAFESSLSFQQVYALPGTRALLIAELNGTLDIRSNLREVTPSSKVQIDAGELSLLDSGHMLGSAQVVLEHPDGYRTAYSGDFQSGLEEVVQCNELVVDSTYGSPSSVRQYSQEQAEDALRERVLERVHTSPIYIYANRGTLQRAMVVLNDLGSAPVLVSARQLKEARVYQRFGYGVGHLLARDSAEGSAAWESGRFVLLEGAGDRPEMNRPSGYSITLTARYAHGREPITEFTQYACAVAVSNHADFAGTLDYVQSTGAWRVLTDNVRGPYGVELALALRDKLGVDARPGSPPARGLREWGE